jgi:hypothetical protein
MAAAEILITFTSNVATGCNRAYYTDPDTGLPVGPFTITCSPALGSCTISIPVTVDPEGCVPVTYVGYIEACCNSVGELGQIPWTATFVPNPDCVGVVFECQTSPSCAVVLPTGSCDTVTEINAKKLATTFTLCYPGGVAGGSIDPVEWSEYTYVDDTDICCSGCQTIGVTGTGNIQYVDCAGVLTNASVTGTLTFLCKTKLI